MAILVCEVRELLSEDVAAAPGLVKQGKLALPDFEIVKGAAHLWVSSLFDFVSGNVERNVLGVMLEDELPDEFGQSGLESGVRQQSDVERSVGRWDGESLVVEGRFEGTDGC